MTGVQTCALPISPCSSAISRRCCPVDVQISTDLTLYRTSIYNLRGGIWEEVIRKEGFEEAFKKRYLKEVIEEVIREVIREVIWEGFERGV